MCSDPERAFYPQRQVCYASMERDAANARWQALHGEYQWHNGRGTSWAKERSASHPFPRDAGLTIGVTETDVRPWDHFLTDPKAPFEQPTEGDGSGGSQPVQSDEGVDQAHGD